MNSQKAVLSLAGCALTLALMAGCASDDRRTEIPTNATLATSGNSKLSYAAPTDGTIWVYDVNKDAILYSGPVARGDAVVVDPDLNLITVGGHTVAEKTLPAGGGMTRVFFQPVNPDSGSSAHGQW
jgi:hypothetical protein